MHRFIFQKIFCQLLVGLVLVSLAFIPQSSFGQKPAQGKSNSPQTIADELLSLELGNQEWPELRKRLHAVMDLGIAKYGQPAPDISEAQRAARFFKAMDDALIESNFIFPPKELIDLLRNALTPRSLSAADYKRAQAGGDNRRRKTQMKSNFDKGGDFYFADCDLTSVIYVAAGERLKLPIVMVGVPQHDFVRWSSPTLKLNWDTNEGKTYSDEYYAKKWGVTEVGRRKLGWLGDLPRDRVFSYWHQMIGNWHERQERYADALASYRAAVAASPDDLNALNTLAWYLATSVDAKLRDGREAVKYARRVVDAAPRANWMDTLAAAQAEQGDFIGAVQTETRAKEAAKSSEWAISEDEHLAGFDKCIAAYRKKLTYRKAAEMGELEDPKLTRPYD